MTTTEALMTDPTTAGGREYWERKRQYEAAAINRAECHSMPVHGDVRDWRMEIEEFHAGCYRFSQSQRFCARCGWIDVRGVIGALGWVAEHDGHSAVVPGDNESLIECRLCERAWPESEMLGSFCPDCSLAGIY